MRKKTESVMAAIGYIESHMQERLDLETVAGALHYSKYHLHRLFAETAGLTLHNYVRRRRLTEAARMLVHSDKSILEIALSAGYESQQAFTETFKAMYKRTPNRCREEGIFYPLQLRYVLTEAPAHFEGRGLREKIVSASPQDIPRWLELVRLVVDGFPRLDERQHLEQLERYIQEGRAQILKDGDAAIGIMAFHETAGSIDFLGVHPQYRQKGIEAAFCKKALYELSRAGQISVTTFREGDRADTGYRKIWGSLGFAEAELLEEFGYPTQRFILRKGRTEGGENG